MNATNFRQDIFKGNFVWCVGATVWYGLLYMYFVVVVALL